MAPVAPLTSRNVAVIGAGAAGLIAAHELSREGHNVVVFERENRIGGTWVYNPDTESDPLGLDPHRKPIIHSSLYKSLRTNLPREVMGFRDYPFVCERYEKGGDLRRYPGHEEVLRYLEGFAEEFGVKELVGFEREVVKVCLVDEKWIVKWRNNNKSNDFEDEEVDKEVEEEEAFDAVVVCNGHYTEPRVAQIPGIGVWPGRQIHSHNYRTPEPFKDQVVVLIGSSASAMDISQELAMVAKDVHMASWSFEEPFGKNPEYSNMWFHPMIERVHEDGTVVFQDGSSTNASIILHCTGYKYHFPFLETDGTVTVDDNRVGPLYKHIFPPALAPGLSFVGIPFMVLFQATFSSSFYYYYYFLFFLPFHYDYDARPCKFSHQVIPFPLFEYQSKWIAGVLSARISLPSREAMMEDIESFYSSLEASSIPKRYTHKIFATQFEYYDWLAAESGCLPCEEWRREMYLAALRNVQGRPETHHDELDMYNHLISQAHEDFKKCTFRATKQEMHF